MIRPTKVTQTVEVVKDSPRSFITGVIIGLLVILFVLPIEHAATSLYDTIRPVIINWNVTDVKTDNNDLILSGTLVKQRDCLFVPPTVARDQYGQNYAVASASNTAGLTWATSPEPQKWGPWIILNGAGKTLTFSNVYICQKDRPAVVRLGTYIPKEVSDVAKARGYMEKPTP